MSHFLRDLSSSVHSLAAETQLLRERCAHSAYSQQGYARDACGHHPRGIHRSLATGRKRLRRLSNLEVDVSALASSSRPGVWAGSGSRAPALLACTILATAGATAASMLLAQRFMQGGSRPRTWSSGF